MSKTCFGLVIALALSLASENALGASGSLRPGNLRCESWTNPEGIDAPQPRLSWECQSRDPNIRGQKQAAYQILAATSRSRLEANDADLWDSSRVESDQCIAVRYAGQALIARQRCFWKVRIWDQFGNQSSWSDPASWQMALMEASEWKARWIGRDETETTNLLAHAGWIWHPAGNAAESAPPGACWFRRTFTLPKHALVESAHFWVTADNECAVYVNGELLGRANNFHEATDVDVRAALRAGENVLAIQATNSGTNANPAGLIGRLRVQLAEGASVELATDAAWRGTDQAAAGWEMPGHNDTGWPAARSLGPAGMAPWGAVVIPDSRALPARLLRREFALPVKARRATLHFSGLGLSELYVNGRRVGDEVLSPGLTDYTKRVFYLTHDVTSLLRRGVNALGVQLGNGRYYAPRLGVPTATRTYGYPKLILQLVIEGEDGSITEVLSDGNWKLTTDGPIRANNEYDGEVYDARKELRGWSAPGFDDTAWEPAQLVAAPGGVLVAQPIDPIRVTQTLKPIALTNPKPGVYIYDLGQNLVGWCRLMVSGPAGTGVTLRHAETLKPDGTLYVDNLRSAKAADTYILAGRGTEVYEPRFTYHGFRYVEVTGLAGRPKLSALEGRVVNDDVASAGDWSSSNPLLNQIYRNVLWGVRGNYRSLPTDCPQRDERQGWLGDRSAESKGETYLFRIDKLYTKWLQDMADSQTEKGSVPDVAPPYWPLYSDNVTWPSSTVIIPGSLLDQYGDASVVGDHYESMKRWIDFMAAFVQDGIMPRDTYGDWCVPPEDSKLIHSQDPARKTAGPLLGSSYFIHDLRQMTRYATLLGKAEDAKRFTELADKMKAAFQQKFYETNRGYFDNGTQTACVLPLSFGLVPDDQRGRVFERLVTQIAEQSKGHVGTGLIGGQWLMRTLSDGGRADLAYALASQRAYPSWGYMVDQGATTIWELWNGNTADPAMNSGNHVMLVGDLIIWFYEYLAGIRPDTERPGFKHIIMRPQWVGDLDFVKASHRSPYGLITSEWRRDGGLISWQVQIPANTTATVYMPARDAAHVTESGVPIARVPGVKVLRAENGRVVLSVGSGKYRFVGR